MPVPKSSLVSTPAPVASPDAPRLRELIKHDEFKAAIEPLLALVGTDSMSIFADGFTVTNDEIAFVSAVPVHDVEPIALGDDPESQVYGWPVSVAVVF